MSIPYARGSTSALGPSALSCPGPAAPGHALGRDNFLALRWSSPCRPQARWAPGGRMPGGGGGTCRRSAGPRGWRPRMLCEHVRAGWGWGRTEWPGRCTADRAWPYQPGTRQSSASPSCVRRCPEKCGPGSRVGLPEPEAISVCSRQQSSLCSGSGSTSCGDELCSLAPRSAVACGPPTGGLQSGVSRRVASPAVPQAVQGAGPSLWEVVAMVTGRKRPSAWR